MALDPGPIAWPALDLEFAGVNHRVFEDLVARAVHDLGGVDAAVSAKQLDASPAKGDPIDEGDDPDLLAGADEFAQASRDRGQFLPREELGAINGLSPTIDQEAHNVPDDPSGLFEPPPPPPYNPDPSNPPPPSPEPPQ